jgi:hypothetical protein
MKTKLFTLILSLLLIAMLLSACGGGNTTGDMPEKQPEVPAGDNSQDSSPPDQPDQQTGDNQPSTQPLPPDDGDGETPSEDPAGGDASTVSFANDVLPILRSRCLTCHGGDRIEGDLVVASYAELLSGGESGAVVIPGDAAGSLLYQLAESGEMPKRGGNLTPVQLDVILQWINAGAPDN